MSMYFFYPFTVESMCSTGPESVSHAPSSPPVCAARSTRSGSCRPSSRCPCTRPGCTPAASPAAVRVCHTHVHYIYIAKYQRIIKEHTRIAEDGINNSFPCTRRRLCLESESPPRKRAQRQRRHIYTRILNLQPPKPPHAHTQTPSSCICQERRDNMFANGAGAYTERVHIYIHP